MVVPVSPTGLGPGTRPRLQYFLYARPDPPLTIRSAIVVTPATSQVYWSFAASTPSPRSTITCSRCERPDLSNLAQRSHLKHPMIPQRRSQDLARCLFGTVAMPRRSPDRPEAGRAYQVDKGAGAIPNARVSLAMDVSGAPSGNRSSAANPAVVMLAALMCSWRHSSKASR